MIMNFHLLLWFGYNEKEEDDSFRHLFGWLCYKEMATCAFFGGFATNKVTITMLLPSYMVMVASCFFFFFCPYGLVH